MIQAISNSNAKLSYNSARANTKQNNNTQSTNNAVNITASPDENGNVIVGSSQDVYKTGMSREEYTKLLKEKREAEWDAYWDTFYTRIPSYILTGAILLGFGFVFKRAIDKAKEHEKKSEEYWQKIKEAYGND